MPTIWNCPYCDKETYKELNHCPHCGIPFNTPWSCENCGEDNPISLNSCYNCGSSIKRIIPQQKNLEDAFEEKDPLDFLGPEHALAMLKKKKIKKTDADDIREPLIKILKKYLEKIMLLIFSLLIATSFLEIVLREFPSIMPYANKWNYLHHYADVSRLLRGFPPHNLSDPKIITIGDSYARGAEVAPGKDWVALLSKKYGHNIFNLAIGGSSNVEQWVLIKEFIFPKSVKQVLLAINKSDIGENLPDLKRHEANGDKPFIQRARKTALLDTKLNGWEFYDSCQINRWYLQLGCWYYKSYLAALLINIYRQLTLGDAYQKTVDIKTSNLVFDPISKRYRKKNINLSEFASQDSWFKKNTDGIATTLLIIKRIQEYLASKNISLVVIYLPVAKELYYSDWAKELNIKTSPKLSAGSVIKSHILEFDLPYKNLTPSLRKVRKSKAPLFLPIDVHPSEQGHKLIAKQVNHFLKSLSIE